MMNEFIPKIYYGDFFKLYKKHIRPASVDLFLSDIPYGLLIDNRLKDVPDCKIDLVELEKSLDYLLAKKGQAVLFCDLNLLIELKKNFNEHLEFKHYHILYKTSAVPTCEYYPLNDCEFAAVFKRKSANVSDLIFNARAGGKGIPYKKRNYDPDISIRNMKKSFYSVNKAGDRWIRTILPMTTRPNMSKEEIIGSNPFQKPERLTRILIDVYSQPESLIVDGFAGSGTTLVSAYEEGRRSIGFELIEKYYNEAKLRIENETNQQRIKLYSNTPRTEIELESIENEPQRELNFNEKCVK